MLLGTSSSRLPPASRSRTRWATSRSTTSRAPHGARRSLLDVVIDRAEIPTFQATPGLRPRRRRDASRRPSGGGAAERVRRGRREPVPRRRWLGPRAGAVCGRSLVPAGRRRAVDDAPGLRLRRAARRADRGRDDGRVRGRLRCRAHRLARDRRHRVRRDGRGPGARLSVRRAGSRPTRPASPVRPTCGPCRSPCRRAGRSSRPSTCPTPNRSMGRPRPAPVAAAKADAQVPGGDASIPDVLRNAPTDPAPRADRAAHGRRAGCGTCPDARPWQDADGGLSRRHARDAATRRRAGPGGERVAHDGDPRARRARAGGRDAAPARTSWSAPRRWSPRCRSSRSAAGCCSRRPGARSPRGAPRGHEGHAVDHEHDHEHGHEPRPRAGARPRRAPRPRPRLGARPRPPCRPADRPRPLPRRRPPHPPATRRLDA